MATVTNTYTTTFTPLAIALVERAGVNESFATIRAGAGTSVYTTGNVGTILTASSTSNQFSSLDRTIVTFDTSSIPSSATITSAAITVRSAVDKLNNIGSPNISVVSSSPANPSSIAAADFNTLGTTAYSTITYAGFSLTDVNTFTLDSTGQANITKNGTTKLGFRNSWDITNSFTGVWSSGQISWFLWSITPNQVTMTVTYTVDFPTLSINNISSLSNVTTITTS